MIKCPRCDGKIVKNYDDVFCLSCGFRFNDNQDPLMKGLLMLERNKRWNSNFDVHYGARTRNSPEYAARGHNARYNYHADGSRTRTK